MAAIVIADSDGTVTYAIGGTPSSGPFVIDYPYFFVTEIAVSKIVSGVSTPLILTTDYTVSGTPADDGFSAGSVSLVAPLSNCTLTIRRVLATTKATNFATSGPFSIRTMNTLFSRLFSWAQDLRRLYGTAPHYPSGEESLGAEYPAAATRKGYVAAFHPTTGAATISNMTLAALEQQPTASAASAAAALASQTAAAASQSAAYGSEVAAAASAVSASTIAAGVTSTSASSVLIGAGAKTFVTQAGKQYAAGMFVKAASTVNPANFMWGTVTSYTTTSLVQNITVIGGSGTLASWNLSVSGSQGADSTSVTTVRGDSVRGGVGGVTERYALGAAGQIVRSDGTDVLWGDPDPSVPQGRLTLTTATPVLSADVAAAATVYYTPYVGNLIPIYDGTRFVPTDSAELSNILADSVTGKAGPAAAGPYQVIDAFVWNDAGTVRLTRGPAWVASGTATITVATPAVVSRTAHGLLDGATVRFTTTGALPTGLALATDYFITVVTVNTFKLSATLAAQVAGTYIATSLAGSGVHTSFNYTSVRGVGAGKTELERLNGIWVNKVAIVNGPAARGGTYVGSIYTNASSQVDFKLGLATGGEALIGVWNAYNRVDVSGNTADSAVSWVYNTAAWRASNGAAMCRATFVSGLREDFVACAVNYTFLNSGAGGQIEAAVGFNSVLSPSGAMTAGSTESATGFANTTGFGGGQPFGLSYAQSIEYCTFANASSNTVYGAGLAVPRGGMTYSWRY